MNKQDVSSASVWLY